MYFHGEVSQSKFKNNRASARKYFAMITFLTFACQKRLDLLIHYKFNHGEMVTFYVYLKLNYIFIALRKENDLD